MKHMIVAQPKTIQEIRDDRYAIYKKSYLHEDLINNVLMQHNWSIFLSFLENRQIMEAQLNYDYDSLEGDLDLSYYQKYTYKGYSLLGITTIAVHTFKTSVSSNKKHVSFSDKKEFIPKLLAFDIEQTKKDKYLALLTKYEEFGPSIIKKMLLLQDILLSLKIELPQELHHIPLLMFEMEESLL
jgi:hypothetical protein